MARDKRDRLTPDLLSWEPPQVAVGYAAEVAGKGELGNRIARLISRALRDARDERGLSRAVAAAAISAELGRKVSEDTLDKWAAEGSDGHRIPLDAFIALIGVTGAQELCGFIPGLFGLVVVDERFEGLIQLELIRQARERLDLNEARVLAELRARK